MSISGSFFLLLVCSFFVLFLFFSACCLVLNHNLRLFCSPSCFLLLLFFVIVALIFSVFGYLSKTSLCFFSFLCFFKFCIFAENTIKIGFQQTKERTRKTIQIWNVKNWSKYKLKIGPSMLRNITGPVLSLGKCVLFGCFLFVSSSGCQESPLPANIASRSPPPHEKCDSPSSLVYSWPEVLKIP